jgi:hypothetical protein
MRFSVQGIYRTVLMSCSFKVPLDVEYLSLSNRTVYLRVRIKFIFG